MGARAVVRYSEGFKQQVVEDVERGRFRGAHEAAGAYGVRGHSTVQRWLRESGRGRLVRGVIRMEKPGEPGELKRLKERVRQLGSRSGEIGSSKCFDIMIFWSRHSTVGRARRPSRATTSPCFAIYCVSSSRPLRTRYG